jgi:dipeptidyl aminopeptidase/acylaminoacyl peptidase
MFWRALLLILALATIGCGAIETVPLEKLARTRAGAITNFLYPTSGGHAEAYLARPRGAGPFPLMILLHGHSFRSMGAERILPAAEAFANDLCYASLAVSLPNYGQTKVDVTAEPDTTLQVILDAIVHAKKLPWIDSKRIFLYGFSRGVIFSSLLVTRIDAVRAVVLHSGAYDLERLYQDTPNKWVRKMLNPNGDPHPKFFSILPAVSSWKAPTLILHGVEDSLVPVNQTQLLRAALDLAKTPYRLELFPGYGHRLPLEEVKEKTLSFLRENSGTACKTTDP